MPLVSLESRLCTRVDVIIAYARPLILRGSSLVSEAESPEVEKFEFLV
jgi:hypothetical protein